MIRHRPGPPTGPYIANQASNQFRGLRGWWPTAGSPSAGSKVLAERACGGKFGVQENGAAWATHAALGQCERFTVGTASRVDLGVVNVTAPLSLMAWCVPNYTNSSVYPKLVCKGHTTPTSAPYIIYDIGSTKASPSKFSMEISAGSGSNVSAVAASTITSGTLYLVVGTYDGAKMRVYINGVASGTPTSTSLTMGTNTVSTYLGTLGGATSNDFDGWIGDTRIYGKCLTPDEVWQLYDPATRWELYEPVRRVWAIDAVAATGRKCGPAAQMM